MNFFTEIHSHLWRLSLMSLSPLEVLILPNVAGPLPLNSVATLPIVAGMGNPQVVVVEAKDEAE